MGPGDREITLLISWLDSLSTQDICRGTPLPLLVFVAISHWSFMAQLSCLFFQEAFPNLKVWVWLFF